MDGSRQRRQPRPRHRGPARVLLVLAALAAAVGGGWAGAGPAMAHDVLRSTNPADGARVEQLPDAVVLTFEEPALSVGSTVTVTGPDGPVGRGGPQLVDTEIRQPLTGGPAGTYTVLWRVTSADGHPVSGTFRFTTLQPRQPTAPSDQSSAGTAALGAAGGAAEGPAAGSAPTSTGPALVLLVGGGVLAVAVLVVGLLRRRRRQSA
jgi:methionine-rich copper-binding protein CopC